MHGKELENLKKYFFQHLAPLIDKVDEKHPGAKKRIYGSHYAMVFKDHLKCGNYKMALLIAFKATKLYPLRFWSLFGAPDKPCGVGRADANPKLLLNDT